MVCVAVWLEEAREQLGGEPVAAQLILDGVIMEPCFQVSLGVFEPLFNYPLMLPTLSGTCWSLSQMPGIFICGPPPQILSLEYNFIGQ